MKKPIHLYLASYFYFYMKDWRRVPKMNLLLKYIESQSYYILSQASYLMSSYHIPNVLFRYSDSASSRTQNRELSFRCITYNIYTCIDWLI